MVRAKNYETVTTFVKVMQKKNRGLFFPDTVYIIQNNSSELTNLVVTLLQL